MAGLHGAASQGHSLQQPRNKGPHLDFCAAQDMKGMRRSAAKELKHHLNTIDYVCVLHTCQLVNGPISFCTNKQMCGTKNQWWEKYSDPLLRERYQNSNVKILHYK